MVMLPRKHFNIKFEKDPRIMSHLRLLQTQRAMIFEYTERPGQPRTMRFNEGFKVFDAGAMVRVHSNPNPNPNPNSESGSNSEEGNLEEKSKMDIWAGDNAIEQTFQCLNQILSQIQEKAKIFSETSERLLIKQSGKRSPDLKLMPAPHLAVRLLSSAVADQLGQSEPTNAESTNQATESSDSKDDDDAENEGPRVKRQRV
ncbi:hypothetical protein F4806DRAFT_181481 [Annulohypoxylon nitens]|nr:hypothetical protein F4806DRAFT_181481 [Annulohypoxylon nitens]